MYTKLDEQRKKQIFNGFIQKGCGSVDTEKEEKQTTLEEEKSPAEVEREKEQNKK